MKKKKQQKKIEIEKYLPGLFARTEGYASNVSKYYTAAVNALLDLAADVDLKPDEVFYFADHKKLSVKATNVLRGLYSAVYQEIRRGVIAEWEFANLSSDAMIESIFGPGLQEDNHYARWFSRNRDAMDAFFKRKSEYGGLNLSQKVWKYTGQFKEEMELALSASLGRGDSASTVSRHVRQYLQEPDKLFRRVRDEEGNLKLSKRAAAYHPGRGEYRSSYKNAMRLARTETNMAYRAADCERWNDIPFVVGMEVRRSNHPFACPVCEALAGKYPKDFKFVGWHPQCRCYIVPILADEKERMAYHRAILNGEDVEGWKFEGEIAEPHAGFQNWVKENQERIDSAQSLPYWIKDNPKYVKTAETANSVMVKDIHDQMDTMSPELRSRTDLRNERAKEYQRLLDDPDYSDVRFDRENGGLIATHKDHKVHENDNKRYFAEQLNGDELEKEFQYLAFGQGHSVIFRAEPENTTDLDMLLDGVKMDLVSVTENSETFCNQLRRKNKQLAKYNAMYGETNDSVCMYFHSPTYYEERKIHEGIRKLRDYGSEILIRNIWVMLNNQTDMFRIVL